MNLRSEVIRLAHANPELRKDLLGVLTKKASTGLSQFEGCHRTLDAAATFLVKARKKIEEAEDQLKVANSITSDKYTESSEKMLTECLKKLDSLYDSLGEPMENISSMVHELEKEGD
jgi:ATP phosphoribosyltransferase regulatory subunit HisZ